MLDQFIEEYELNEAETEFFKALYTQFDIVQFPGALRLQRLSDHTFNVWFDATKGAKSCYVGKVRLWGRRFYFQYMQIENNGAETIHYQDHPTREICIASIPKWLKYIHDINDPIISEKIFQYEYEESERKIKTAFSKVEKQS